jgi:hypothetical protein
MALAQCAHKEDDDRFRVGASPRALVIVGVAEAYNSTDADYSLLWRRVGPDGRFEEIGGHTAIEAETNARGTVRVRGIPGEFKIAELEPGVYALDSAFAVIHDRVNYIANGVIEGPSRPSFEVRAGEAVYLGIWQMDVSDASAVTRPWRLEASDAQAVLHEANPANGDVRVRETSPLDVPCAPHRRSNITQREVC